MAENLLWPTKLSMPPQLLIDPEVLFNNQDIESSPGIYLPLISPVGPAKVRYIGLVPNGFMIGFVWNVYKEMTDTCRTILPLPFQDLTTEILQYKLHGWYRENADILSTPDQTKWKTKLNVSALAMQMYGNHSSAPSRKPLFKMVGNNLEDSGSKPQFSSSIKYGSYSAILYTVPYETFYENLPLEFPDMFSEFPNDPPSTLAIETVVKVGIISATDTDGFKIGVVSS